jgi:ceramide glucosyltransferase
LLFDKLLKHALIVHFLRRRAVAVKRAPELVSILQPILSGDPTLRAGLEHNLRTDHGGPVEFIWLVDNTDAVGLRLCRELIAAYPDVAIRLEVLPPPPAGRSPKLVKLSAGLAVAHGTVYCVLDDDTMLPTGGLRTACAALTNPAVGVACGLPYYVSFGNFWSACVATFVNSHSLATYIPYTYCVPPFTLNGMFYVFRRDVYETLTPLREIEHWLADDFAVAQHFRAAGYRIAQTTVCHAISTHVRDGGAYARLLQRWFIFPRESILRALPPRDAAVSLVSALLPALGPMAFAALLVLAPAAWPLALAYVGLHWFSWAHLNARYLERATPWTYAWLVLVVQLLLPVQLLAAFLAPQRIVWRGHRMHILPGGGFRLVQRRAEVCADEPG